MTFVSSVTIKDVLLYWGDYDVSERSSFHVLLCVCVRKVEVLPNEISDVIIRSQLPFFIRTYQVKKLSKNLTWYMIKFLKLQISLFSCVKYMHITKKWRKLEAFLFFGVLIKKNCNVFNIFITKFHSFIIL